MRLCCYRYDLIRKFLADTSPAILALAETHLTQQDADCYYQYDGYNFFRQDRSFATHGGLAFYIKNNFSSLRLDDLCCNTPVLECLAIECRLPPGEAFIVMVLYRTNFRTNTRAESRSAHGVIADLVERAAARTPNVVVCGDINMPDPAERQELEHELLGLGLAQHVDVPTHVMGNLLDVLFAPAPLVDAVAASATCVATDHFTLSCDLSPRLSSSPGDEGLAARRRFDVGRLNLEKFARSYYSMRGWLNATYDVDAVWRLFVNIIMTCLQASCPLVNGVRSGAKKSKRVALPVAARLHRHQLNKVLAALKNVALTSSERRSLLKWRKKLNKRNKLEVSAARRAAVAEAARQFEQKNGRYFWAQYYKLIGKSSTQAINSCTTDKGRFTGAAEVAGALRDMFATNFVEPDAVRGEHSIAVGGAGSVAALAAAYTPEKMVKICRSIGTAGAQFLIDVPVLKAVIHIIANELSDLLRRCVSAGVFPTIGKRCLVQPVPKDGGGYRPISLIPPMFCYFFETPLFEYLLEYAEKRGVFPSFQYGFRPRMGIDDAVYHLLAAIVRAQSAGFSRFAVIFLDVAKAFDRLPHDAILEALRYYAVPEGVVKLVASWLGGRSAEVINGGARSLPLNLPSGVPQGSKLGPLLFLFALSMACDRAESGGIHAGNTVVYADDSTLFRGVNSADDVRALQAQVNTYVAALGGVGLQVNARKCALMLFDTGCAGDVAVQITIGGVDVLRVEQHKFLGVMLSSDLDFSAHAKYVGKACSGRIYALKHLVSKHLLDKRAQQTLYKSLVVSKASFAMALTKPFLKADSAGLEKLQQRFTKSVLSTRAGPCPLSYSERLDKLRLHRFSNMIDVDSLVYIYRCLLRGDSRNVVASSRCVSHLRRPALIEETKLGKRSPAHFDNLVPHRAPRLFNSFLTRINAKQYIAVTEKKLSVKQFRNLCYSILGSNAGE